MVKSSVFGSKDKSTGAWVLGLERWQAAGLVTKEKKNVFTKRVSLCLKLFDAGDPESLSLACFLKKLVKFLKLLFEPLAPIPIADH